MSVFELWLPILLAGLAVHIACTIAWTAMPHHKPEWRPMDQQTDLIAWLKEKGAAPGQYIFPHHETAEKPDGCQGMMVLWSQPPNMGANIGLTVAHSFAVSFVIGYLASLGVPAGAKFMEVFQFVTTAGILTHVFCGLPNVIWFRRKILMDVIDGLVYALITGAIFAALWPAASA
ncbi:MAG: hypothetical protein AAGJ46_13640 [Planctomycetota bacterium]